MGIRRPSPNLQGKDIALPRHSSGIELNQESPITPEYEAILHFGTSFYPDVEE
jgi:hypothetical protein